MLSLLKKKIIVLLFIAATLLPLFTATVPQFASAQALPKSTSADQGNPVYCIQGLFPPVISPTGCAMLAIAGTLNVGMRLTAYILNLAGALMDYVLSIQATAFHDQPLVNIGWKIVRDVVNMTYMFFLLIIAIATILQIESYGMKRLLANLIISAVLVNFSLPITGAVIDLSNVLGNTFYQSIGEPTKNTDGTPNEGVRDISTNLVTGFNVPKAYQPGSPSPDGTGASSDKYGVLFNYIIAMFMGIILMLIASYTILTAALLLLIRIVSLWIVLILAPLAFLAYVIPALSGIYSQWSNSLFKQAFFYPAYMFFLYLVVNIIEKGAIAGIVGTGNLQSATGLNSYDGSAFSQSPKLILSMVTLAVLLMASLKVASQMGATGAGEVQKGLKKARSYTQNKISSGARYVGRRANSATGGFGSQAFLGSRAGQAVGSVPVLRQALRPLATAAQKAKKDADAKAKQDAARAQNLNTNAAATMSRTLDKRAKASYFESLKDDKKKKDYLEAYSKQDLGDAPDPKKYKDGENDIFYKQALEDYNRDKQKATIQLAKDLNTSDPLSDSTNKYSEQIAKATGDITLAMKLLHDLDEPKESASQEEKDAYQKKVTEYVSGLNEKELRNVDEKSLANPYFQKAAEQTFRPEDWRQIAQTSKKAGILQEQMIKKFSGAKDPETGREIGEVKDATQLQTVLDKVRSDEDIEKEVRTQTTQRIKEAETTEVKPLVEKKVQEANAAEQQRLSAEFEKRKAAALAEIEQKRKENEALGVVGGSENAGEISGRDLDIQAVEEKIRADLEKEKRTINVGAIEADVRASFKGNIVDKQAIEDQVRKEVGEKTIPIKVAARATGLKETDIKWLKSSPGQNIAVNGQRATVRGLQNPAPAEAKPEAPAAPAPSGESKT